MPVKTGIKGWLPATGLGLRKLDRQAKTAQDTHRGLPSLRIQGIP
jgi:hypothetical protein